MRDSPVQRTTDRRPLRVLFCLDNLGIGGTEMNAIRTAEQIDPERVAVSVAYIGTDDGPLLNRYESAGIPIARFPVSNLYGRRTLLQGLQFARFVRTQRFDVVHTHDVYTNIFAVPWARAGGAKAVLASRRWWTAVMPSRAHRVANRCSYKLADAVLVNGRSIATLLEHQEGVARSRIAVVPNFVDDAAFEPVDNAWVAGMRGRFGVAPDAIVIGIVANLHPVKNHALLLRAAATLTPRWPGLRLLIVGEGKCRPALEALAAELNISERITFTGHLPQHPSPHHLFDISVLTSREEGLPNSIIEAMAAGRPVVATAVGGVPDAIEHGESGYLVSPDDHAALADALDALLLDPERRRRLGAAAQSHAERRFRATQVLPLLVELYGRLAQGGGDATH